jgi:hypothetical protein
MLAYLFLKNGLKDADWINLTQNSDQRMAFANTMMKFPLPYKAGNFLGSYLGVMLR